MSKPRGKANMNHKKYIKTVYDDKIILYFGKWINNNGMSSNSQYSTCFFSFFGDGVKWSAETGIDKGIADVYIDEIFIGEVDNYSKNKQGKIVFEKNDLKEDQLHTMKIVVKKKKNPLSAGYYQTILGFESYHPTNYVKEITALKNIEYKHFHNGTKDYQDPAGWTPVSHAAFASEGLSIQDSPIKTLFDINLKYLFYCFSQESYCEGDESVLDIMEGYRDSKLGDGWGKWLPAANDGRMLMAASNSIKYCESKDGLMKIRDDILDRIIKNMREDGFYNYYPESQSYDVMAKHDSPINPTMLDSERKNFERLYWSKGLIAAARSGRQDALIALRQMGDWFNHSKYLPMILEGCNATNALPYGAVMYNSGVGQPEDIEVSQRYCDQEYWMDALSNRESLCMAFYPGNRAHCYELQGFIAFIEEYIITGNQKYFDAAIGAWYVYYNNYKHIGGATAICEVNGPYPPKSYYLTYGHNGETCASVLWSQFNATLLQLYPNEEKYAAEIEEAIYNIYMSAQDNRGHVRYHNFLHDKKDPARSNNTCCEVTLCEELTILPERIYTIDENKLYINLFASSQYAYKNANIKMETNFPYECDVSINLSNVTSNDFSMCIRVPKWSSKKMDINVNGVMFKSGSPGNYIEIKREWCSGDCVQFKLQAGLRAIQYTGFEQADRMDRWAILYGPVLLALVCDIEKKETRATMGTAPIYPSVARGELPDVSIPVIRYSPNELITRLKQGEKPLEFILEDDNKIKFIPYYAVRDETFTCFPAVYDA